MTDFLQYLTTLNPLWVCLIVFFVSYIENIFPPSPSDVIVVFGGALAAMDGGSFFSVWFAATVGSTLGFLTMYGLGKLFGKKIIERGKPKYTPVGSMVKVEQWFQRYGYGIIIANRFLAGTRAVVSFFAGMSNLRLAQTTLLSFFSSLAWYGILVYAGYSLGAHWERVGWYLSTYGQVVTAVIILILLILIIRYWSKNKPAGSSHE